MGNYRYFYEVFEGLDELVAYNSMVSDFEDFFIEMRDWSKSAESFSQIVRDLLVKIRHNKDFWRYLEIFEGIKENFVHIQSMVEKFSRYDLARGELLTEFEMFLKYLKSFPYAKPRDFRH